MPGNDADPSLAAGIGALREGLARVEVATATTGQKVDQLSALAVPVADEVRRISEACAQSAVHLSALPDLETKKAAHRHKLELLAEERSTQRWAWAQQNWQLILAVLVLFTMPELFGSIVRVVIPGLQATGPAVIIGSGDAPVEVVP